MLDPSVITDIMPVAQRVAQDGGAWAVFAVLALKLALDRRPANGGGNGNNGGNGTTKYAIEDVRHNLDAHRIEARGDVEQTRELIRDTNDRVIAVVNNLNANVREQTLAISQLSASVIQQTALIESFSNGRWCPFVNPDVK